MINFETLIKEEVGKGYNSITAAAKVCQDLVLYALSKSRFSENITIKGGVLMRDKTRNVRRATLDIDIDFIRYSLSDGSIDLFIKALNCVNDFTIKRVGEIEELKQQDYHGKRVYVLLNDSFSHELNSKIDFGVHNRLEIKQEEYNFCIDYDSSGVTLLANTNEQIFCEKLRSLLKFGSFSTRYKDVFDLCFLSKRVSFEKLNICVYI